MVQNVVLQREGPIATLLDYGDLRIEMTNARVIFRELHNPEAAQQRILQQRMRLQTEAREEEHAQIRQAIEQAVRPANPLPPPPPALKPVLAPPSKPRRSFREWLSEIAKLRIERDGQIIWRKHWWILLKQTFRGALLALFGVVFTIVSSVLINRLPPGLSWVLIIPGFVTVCGIGWFAWEWVDWQNDEYILTQDRIIDIERKPLGFGESRREGGLDRIQDIEVILPGILSNLFNTGDVRIKTAAAGGDFTFNYVSDPRGVQRDIFHRLALYRRQQEQQQRKRRFEEMAQWFSVYSEVTGQQVARQPNVEQGVKGVEGSDGIA
jgi:hypothetical protein